MISERCPEEIDEGPDIIFFVVIVVVAIRSGFFLLLVFRNKVQPCSISFWLDIVQKALRAACTKILLRSSEDGP